MSDEATIVIKDDEEPQGIVRVTIEGTMEQVLAVFGMSEIAEADLAIYDAERRERAYAARRANKIRLERITTVRRKLHRAYCIALKDPVLKGVKERLLKALTGRTSIDDPDLIAEAESISEAAANQPQPPQISR